MSIAFSAALQPSKKLDFLAILFVIVLGLIAIYFGCATPFSFPLRLLLIGLCLVVSIAGFFRIPLQNRQSWRVAVDLHGQFCCELLPPTMTPGRQAQPSRFFEVVGTTFWPGLLFLQLRQIDSDKSTNLVIFSDALDKVAFRRLSIACRWLIKHAQ